MWVHTCWGNPNQQRVYWEVPSYERALPHLLQLKCDVITFECASSDGRDLALFGKYKTDKKIGIGVVNHCNTVVEPAEHVANLIRKALEYIPPERLVVTTIAALGARVCRAASPITNACLSSRTPISCAANWASRKRISAPPTPASISRALPESNPSRQSSAYFVQRTMIWRNLSLPSCQARSVEIPMTVAGV